MPTRQLLFRLSLTAALVLLQGCGFMHLEMNQLADSLQNNGAEKTLAELEKIAPADRDRVQYLLNRGTLKKLTGDYQGADDDLQNAKQLSASLAAASVSENLGAATINETLRSFVGSASERVIIHSMLALNYLNQGDLLAARVEMLQADITMRQLAKPDSNSGQLASSHYLAGVIYELNNEFDNAMISYRHAAELVDARGLPMPQALADSLLYLSRRNGLKQQYQQYQQRFNRSAAPLNAGEYDIFVFYSDGVVSNKRQHFISVYSFQLQQNLALALPYYPPSNYRPRPLYLSVNSQKIATQPIENINQLVREDLDAELPAITATTLLRAAAKYQAVKQAQSKDDIAGLLLNLATTFSETADRRSWNMLPANLQIARLRVAKGQAIDVQGSSILNELNQQRGFTMIDFKQSPSRLILANSISRPALLTANAPSQ